MKRLNVTRDDAEKIVDRIEGQEFVSTFVPFETAGVAPESWNGHQTHLTECAHREAGAATQKVVPLAMQHAFSITSEPYALRQASRRGRFHFNEVELRMGRPALDLDVLERMNVATLLLVPHLQVGGPNGIWRIERGPRHSVVQAFESVKLWLLGNDGVPAVIGIDDAPYVGTYWTLLWTLDAYSQHSLAVRAIRDDASDQEVIELTGSALLRAIGRSDEVSVDGETISTHQTAQAFLARLGEVRTTRSRRRRPSKTG